MTRVLVGYDGSDAAGAAIAAAAALFPSAEATIATVQPPPPTVEAGAMARVALPDAVIREGIERMREQAEERSRALAAEGVALAHAAGLQADPVVLVALSPWRALRDAARAYDVLVCGARGEGPVERVLVGSTASSLVHHTARPLLVVPAGVVSFDGPVFAGYDGSDGARLALRFAADQLGDRPVIVAHAWRSPVRHTLRGHALMGSGIDTFADYAETVDTIWREVAEDVAADGATFARGLGLTAEPRAPESGHGDWQTLRHGALEASAAVVLVGSRGRGAAAATVLGSVASGLVHAAALPVLVVPGNSAVTE
jgi:nucleotide-binding universal stress UspA family protein